MDCLPNKLSNVVYLQRFSKLEYILNSASYRNKIPWKSKQHASLLSPNFWVRESIVNRAAFERISAVSVIAYGNEPLVDVRYARLPSVTPPLDDFCPRKCRKPKTPMRISTAYFNLIRSLSGAGILTLPLAYSQTGYILGPIIAISLGLLLIHTHLTLLWCLNEISRQLKIPYISYIYGFRLAMLRGPLICQWVGNNGQFLIISLMVMSQLGICTVCVIMCSDSLRDLMDWQSSAPACGVLLIPYLILEIVMKDIKIIGYISLAGNILNLFGLAGIFYLIFTAHYEIPLVPWNFSPTGIMFGSGVMLFNSSAVAVILSIDRSLQKPEILLGKFGMISISITTTTIGSIILGISGYIAFGKMEENVLRVIPLEEIMTLFVLGVYLFTLALTYPISIYPAVKIILFAIANRITDEPPTPKALNILQWIVRPAFVCTSFFICYLVPFQAPFVALTGNLCTCLLAIVFPAAMELSLRYPHDYGSCYVHFFKNLIIIILGLTMWIFGVFLCVNLIYVKLLSMRTVDE